MCYSDYLWIIVSCTPYLFHWSGYCFQTLLELSIQEAFLHFMACLMKGYKNYLKEVVGPHHTDRKPEFESTNIQSLFDMQGRTIGSRAELNLQKKLSHLMTKPTKWSVRPAKTQISLGIHPVWSVFAVRCKDSQVPKASSCGQQMLWSDWGQTGPLLRLIWVFNGRTCYF